MAKSASFELKLARFWQAQASPTFVKLEACRTSLSTVGDWSKKEETKKEKEKKGKSENEKNEKKNNKIIKKSIFFKKIKIFFLNDT